MTTSQILVRAIDAPVDETAARLERIAEDAGLRVFARIDHRAAALKAGLDMPATLVLVVGNPRGGTPAMLAAPDAALDLPLHILLREDGSGRTLVVHRPISRLLQDVGVPPEIAERLGDLQRKLVEAL